MQVLPRFLAVLLAISAGTVCYAQTEEPTVAQYLKVIAAKCLKAYFPPQRWESCKAAAVFTLHPDGTASEIKIRKRPVERQTGRISFVADAALGLAVRNASPFPKPPSTLKTPARILVSFDGTRVGEPLSCAAGLDAPGKHQDIPLPKITVRDASERGDK